MNSFTMALEISMTLYSRKPRNNVRDINILDSNYKQSYNIQSQLSSVEHHFKGVKTFIQP